MGNHETFFKNCPHLKAEQKVCPQRAGLPLHLEEKKQEPAEVLGKDTVQLVQHAICNL